MTASRATILFGTEEPVEPLRRLTARPLTAELDRGNLRYIRWGGLEVIRAVAFVIRDTSWGTYAPAIAGLDVRETSDGFSVRYTARCEGPNGDFTYRAEIAGSADGRLSFVAHGSSERGFDTNRTGFVILHPLKGVVGKAVEVEHPDGRRSASRFPELVSPQQPIFDIRALTHEPVTGVSVSVRMEGETFEMEDHRNWTDASFKTYVRPLALGFPYRIAAGEAVEQTVTLTIAGKLAEVATEGAAETRLILRGVAGLMPRIGLFVEPDRVAEARGVAAKVAELKPSFLIGRVDLRGGTAVGLDELLALASAIGTPVALQAIIAGVAPEKELAPLKAAIAGHETSLDSLLVVPARDLKSRAPDTTPAGEATAADILAATRTLFPGVRLAGGMPIPFPELNRNRPPPGIDLITHATQGTVHAGDDISAMETLQSIADIATTVRGFSGGVPYRIGPTTVGSTLFAGAGASMANPDRKRVAMAADDPRHRALFGAAFAMGIVAAAAREGLEAVTVASPTGPFGLFADDGSPYPIAGVIAELAAQADRPRLGASIRGPAPVAAIVADTADGPRLMVANLGGAPLTVKLEGGSFRSIRRINAEALAVGSVDATGFADFAGPNLALDSYEVAILI